jgi:FkbM family methyltransferase
MKEWFVPLIEKASDQMKTNRGVFDGFSPIFIYGTGTFAKDIYRVLIQDSLEVSGFLDHRMKDGMIINALPVRPPNDPNISPKQRRDSIVVLGIHNREVDLIPIIKNLNELGFQYIISSIDLYDHYAEELKNRYWLTSRTYYSSHASEIQAVYDLLADDKSRETFESLLRFRITGDYSLLPKPDMEHQYFPPDLPAWQQPLRFVDCGAYDGDTLGSFLNTGHQFDAVAAFEPDQDNFHKLSACVIGNRSKLPNTSLFPCGVYSSTAQLTFETGKGEASVASQSGTSVIQCISLDECIPTFQPTLIKMDIEGAEIDALLGAQQIIKEYHPALAISAYHTPAHLWEIPLRINQIATQNNLHYTYHYRAHAHNCFDTIFYAIPKG